MTEGVAAPPPSRGRRVRRRGDGGRHSGLCVTPGSAVRGAVSWGCSVWGDSFGFRWLRGCFGFPGERIATRSVWGCSSVGALGRHSWSASQDTTRLGGSAAPARPPRVWPTSVRHERVTPDESTCSPLRRMASGRVRPSPGAPGEHGAAFGTSQDKYATHSSCGSSTSPPSSGRRLRRSDNTARCLEQDGAESRPRSASEHVRWGLQPYATA